MSRSLGPWCFPALLVRNRVERVESGALQGSRFSKRAPATARRFPSHIPHPQPSLNAAGIPDISASSSQPRCSGCSQGVKPLPPFSYLFGALQKPRAALWARPGSLTGDGKGSGQGGQKLAVSAPSAARGTNLTQHLLFSVPSPVVEEKSYNVINTLANK